MLLIEENIDLYRYEIHSLVKAFYPAEDVKVLVENDRNSEKIRKEHPEIFMKVTMLPEKIELQILPEKEVPSEKAGNKANAEKAKCGANFPKSDAGNRFGRVFTAATGADYSAKCKGTKDALKTCLYETLANYTGKRLPWGDLIGIRPTKIAMTRMEEGTGEEETVAFLKEEHQVLEEKARLAVDIARREKRILSGIHYENGYSLYVGIPFCPTTCLYCSFPSFNIALWKERIGEYLSALERELEETAAIMKGRILDTVYIGGGTPTSLEAEELDRLCSAIEKNFDMSTVQEFTVEAGRPDSITKEKLQALRRHPITRISVNPQTMKEETLRIIGRHHTVQQVVDTFRLARECGFDNINMDLILGLPGEDAEDVRCTAQKVCKLNPDSLTVHSLAIKRASRLRRVIDEKGYPVLINTDETMEIARQAALSMDMEPYYLYRQKNMSGNFENVGYAREGKYGIYNILIMEEKQTIVALGAGAITKRVFPDGRIERCDNAKEVSVYLDNLDEMLDRKRKLFTN